MEIQQTHSWNREADKGQLQKGRVNICGQQGVHYLEEDDVWPNSGAASLEALLVLAAPPSAQ